MSDYFIKPIGNRFINIALFFLALTNFYLLPGQTDTTNSGSKFKIVFVADVRVAANKEWVDRVATDWGATGICLRIFWGHVDTDSIPGADNWANLDKAIRTITENKFNNKKLDIYLRVCMGLQKPVWVSPTNFRFVRDDFQIKYDNNIYDHQDYEKGIPESEKYPLNFNSPNSQRFMENFLREVLEHIDEAFPDTVRPRIKEIVPTFSTSDEEEYPFSAMCGYSAYENEEFIKYLKYKYSDNLYSLNNRWNPNGDWKKIKSWSDISPGDYFWHTYDNSEYNYSNGRVDWINFRTEQLSSFINSLSELITSFNFQSGIQLGSIYDDLIERRGWVDPTRLFEKVNSVHVADIYQYAENFDFGAEYLSSICKFWIQTNSLFTEPVRFTTETNWPNFNNKDPLFLSIYWKEQLTSYYNQGASEHYLVGWDITPSELDKSKELYKIWRKTLLSFSNKDILKINNKVAVHLGVELVFYNHNVKSILYKTFELNSFISSEYKSTMTTENYSSGKDIITNYMIENNPRYMNNYNSINFAETNGYITEKAYQKLINYLIEKDIINTNISEFSVMDASLVKYKNEYDKKNINLPATISPNNN